MSDMNNNPFGEERQDESANQPNPQDNGGYSQNNPYASQGDVPRNNPAFDPYAQPNANNNQPNGAYDPYNQQPNGYAQPNGAYDPYNQQPNGYAQPNGAFDPYNQQPQQNGYNQNGGQYGQMNNGYAQLYGQPQMKYPTGLATASMIIGIAALVLFFPILMVAPFFYPVLGIVGIILGAIYKSKHYPVGKGISTAGIVTSSLSLVFFVLFLVFAVWLVLNINQVLPMLKEYDEDTYREIYEQYHDAYPEWFEGISALLSRLFR